MSQWQQQQYQRPAKLEIDLNQATFQSFLNCINSFQGLETTSMMQNGSSIMESKVSMERFIYNLGILAGITGQEGYNSDMEQAEAFTFWAKMVKYLTGSDFFKHARRIAHL